MLMLLKYTIYQKLYIRLLKYDRTRVTVINRYVTDRNANAIANVNISD